MISLILGLAILGCILWAIETYIPMDPAIKMLIRIIVVVAVQRLVGVAQNLVGLALARLDEVDEQ